MVPGYAASMRLLAASSVLFAAGLAGSFGALSPGVSAQDPSRDLPAERVPGVTAEQALELGLARLRAGWHWEAARMFRELMVRDETKPMAHLLMALAMRDEPNRAARYCFDALARREHAAASERRLLEAYQAYFGVTDQPDLNDARFLQPPGRANADALVIALAALEGDSAVGGIAKELGLLERAEREQVRVPASLVSTASDPDAANPNAVELLLQHSAYANHFGAMPFMAPGYSELWNRANGSSSNWLCQDRIPTHPHHKFRRIGGQLPGFTFQKPSSIALHGWKAIDSWQPRKAIEFALPRGVGGTAKLADYSGKPVLVIFFLGFGCAHCVAQLSDLDPKAPRFREAGIEVVTIGTDDLNAVKAARQAADENGVDPLHFDVLCDPEAAIFKQWGVWDQFTNEALHGTFLIDGLGRILWQDISLRPFEESNWLLAESKRLLAAWQ